MFSDLYEKIDLLKDAEKEFISWICPLFKTMAIQSGDFVFKEGESINNIYFPKPDNSEPSCAYVLPMHFNFEPFMNTKTGLEPISSSIRLRVEASMGTKTR